MEPRGELSLVSLPELSTNRLMGRLTNHFGSCGSSPWESTYVHLSASTWAFRRFAAFWSHMPSGPMSPLTRCPFASNHPQSFEESLMPTKSRFKQDCSKGRTAKGRMRNCHEYKHTSQFHDPAITNPVRYLACSLVLRPPPMRTPPNR